MLASLVYNRNTSPGRYTKSTGIIIYVSMFSTLVDVVMFDGDHLQIPREILKQLDNHSFEWKFEGIE